MKRRSFVKGAVALPVGLAACGGSGTTTPNTDVKGTEEDVSSTFWTPEELPEDSASTSTFMVVPVVLVAHMDPEVLWDLLVVFLDLLEVLWDLPEVLASPSTECSSLPEVVTA